MQNNQVAQAQPPAESFSNVRRLTKLFGSVLRISSTSDDNSATSISTFLVNNAATFDIDTTAGANLDADCQMSIPGAFPQASPSLHLYDELTDANVDADHQMPMPGAFPLASSSLNLYEELTDANVDADHQMPMPGAFPQVSPLNFDEEPTNESTFQDACCCVNGLVSDQDMVDDGDNFGDDFQLPFSNFDDGDVSIICLLDPGTCSECDRAIEEGRYQNYARDAQDIEEDSDEELGGELVEQHESETSSDPKQVWSSALLDSTSQPHLFDDDVTTSVERTSIPVTASHDPKQYESYLTSLLERHSPPTVVATAPSQVQDSNLRTGQHPDDVIPSADQELHPNTKLSKDLITPSYSHLRPQEGITFLGIPQILIKDDRETARKFRAKFMQLSKDQQRQTPYPSEVHGFGWMCQVPRCVVGIHNYYRSRIEMIEHYICAHPGMPYNQIWEFVDHGKYNHPIPSVSRYVSRYVPGDVNPEVASLELEKPILGSSAPKESVRIASGSKVYHGWREFWASGAPIEDESVMDFELPPSISDHSISDHPLTSSTVHKGYSEPEDSPDGKDSTSGEESVLNHSPVEEDSISDEENVLSHGQLANELQSLQGLPDPYNSMYVEFFRLCSSYTQLFDDYKRRRGDSQNRPTPFEAKTLQLTSEALKLAGNLLQDRRV